MQRFSQRTGQWLVCGALLAGGAVMPSVTYAESKPRSNTADDAVWRKTVKLVTQGEFETADKTLTDIDAHGPRIDQVRAWLDTYEKQQVERAKMDRADFETYVGYAKARVERKEFRIALSWALSALDCADDQDAFRQSTWLLDLVNEALAKADDFRAEDDWRGAWRFYTYLSRLYENEPRYDKLEREAITHLRFDSIFKETNPWREHIQKVRWTDAEKAFEYLGIYYVEPVDFKSIAESALEQLLLLADSTAAQKAVDGLQNEDDRNDFVARVQQHLDQVRVAPKLSRRDCVGHLRRVATKINAQTVQLPEGLIVSEIMRGALEPLDDFTTVIWPVDSKEFDKHTRGNFVGVGISIIKNRNDRIEVVTPMEDAPAYHAGIQAGDLIIKADDTDLKGVSVTKAVETITGRKGTTVTLTIERDGQEIEFPLVRSTVKIRSVKGLKRDPVFEEQWDHWLDKENGIGYVRVLNFQKNTVEDLDNALSQLGAQGLRGLVLDLRGNPGGLLDSAWHLSSRFLKRGDTVVSTKGRIKMEDHVFKAPTIGPYSDLPLVVLVDGRSASASEIVSGAIRDNNRGVVLGERTFGKFSVQNLVRLSHTGAKLKITTAKYYLPGGDSLHRTPTSTTWGVEPSVHVRLRNKERYNIWEMQREANLLGPAKAKEKEEDDDENSDKADEAKTEDALADKDAANKTDAKDDENEEGKDDGALAEADGDGDGQNKDLPKLEQPDKNDRPKIDPQLDTALLMLRVKLLGNSRSAVAAVEPKTPNETPATP